MVMPNARPLRVGRSADASSSGRFLQVVVLLSQRMIDAERNVGTRQKINVALQTIRAVLFNDISADGE